MPAEPEIWQRLSTVLREHLTLVAPGDEIPQESTLGELGLDSMNAINLMLDLEGEFGVTFPDSMLNEETFRSGNTLVQAITDLLVGQAGVVGG
jgi:acyl carrier protein